MKSIHNCAQIKCIFLKYNGLKQIFAKLLNELNPGAHPQILH